MIEGNLIKEMLGLRKRHRTTSLLKAMRIEGILEFVKRMKAKLVAKIADTYIGRMILKHDLVTEPTRNQRKSSIYEVGEMGKLIPYVENNCSALVNLINEIKYKAAILSLKSKTVNDGVSDSVRSCIVNMNDKNMKMLQLLTKF